MGMQYANSPTQLGYVDVSIAYWTATALAAADSAFCTLGTHGHTNIDTVDGNIGVRREYAGAKC